MLYPLLKVGLAFQIWRWLKPRLLGLALLIGSILIILIAHSEYLNYVERTNNTQFVLMSYLLKWGGLLLVVSAYGAYNWFALRRARLRRLAKAGQDQPMEDGFDFLRNKRKLRSQNEPKE